MQTVDLPTAHIFVRSDARKVNDATVASLVESIREIGIINPIRVRRRGDQVNGVEADAYEATAGAHRLRAARKLGLETVPCIIVADSDLHAELAMIDENLCRAELSPADRASQTARRKAICEALGINSKAGQASAAGMNAALGNNVSENFSPTFTAETAAKIGRTQRLVQLDVQRGTEIAPAALDLVRGTALDTGTYLDKLKRIEGEEEQVAAVQRALAGIARQDARDREEAAANRNKSRVEADVKTRAAKEVADILAEHVPGEMWDALKANLYAAGANNIASAFNNITGESVMDRNWGDAA